MLTGCATLENFTRERNEFKIKIKFRTFLHNKRNFVSYTMKWRKKKKKRPSGARWTQLRWQIRQSWWNVVYSGFKDTPVARALKSQHWGKSTTVSEGMETPSVLSTYEFCRHYLFVKRQREIIDMFRINKATANRQWYRTSGSAVFTHV